MHVRKRHKVAIAAAAAAFTGGTLVVVLGIPFAAGGAPLPERAGAPAASGEPASEPLREPVPAELDLLHTARELLLRDCMRAKGFVYQPVPRQPVPEAREFHGARPGRSQPGAGTAVGDRLSARLRRSRRGR
ncbi:hypothetical protein [Streptomyces sp. NPDC054961]